MSKEIQIDWDKFFGPKQAAKTPDGTPYRVYKSCNAEIHLNKKGSNSNLKSHLQNKHNDQWNEYLDSFTKNLQTRIHFLKDF